MPLPFLPFDAGYRENEADVLTGVGRANSVRTHGLNTLLTRAPEGAIFGENDVTAVFTNLTAVLQNFHRPEFGPRNTIGTARRFVSAIWTHSFWPVCESVTDALRDFRRCFFSSSKRLISSTNSRSFAGSCSFAANSHNCSQCSLVGSSKGNNPHL